MKSFGLIFCCFALIIANGCGDSSEGDKSVVQIPDFRIVDLQNTSTGEQKRFSLKIVLPSHYSEDSVRSTLPAIAKTLNEAESEITIFFYGPHTDPQGGYDIARVVWVDDRVEKIDYKQPIPVKQSDLKSSGKFGLLGVPLPAGAKLIESRPGDPSRRINPTERYSINADAEHISSFFQIEMVRAGWAIDGAAEEKTLFFTKNGAMIGIIVNMNGSSFTLMVS